MARRSGAASAPAKDQASAVLSARAWGAASAPEPLEAAYGALQSIAEAVEHAVLAASADRVALTVWINT